MADLFGDNFGEQTAAAQDAGQDFLAQEQNEIAALENQFLESKIEDNQQSQQPTNEADLFGSSDPFGVQNTEVVQENDIDLLAGGDDDTPAAETEMFESMAEQPAAAEPIAAIPVEENNSPIVSTPISNNMSTPAYDIKIEPDSIRKWREEFNQRLTTADEKEASDKQQMLDQAKMELEAWAKQRKDTLEKTKIANREAETAFIEERESRSKGEVSPGDIDWTKTSELCDFNPKSSKGSKDTSRMRSLFLHLREQK